MIIAHCLAVALLVPAPPVSGQDELLALLPLDSSIVMTIGDTAALLAAENPSAWTKVLTDDRIADLLRSVTSLDAGDDQGVDQLLYDALGSLHGAAFALTAWADDEEPETIVGAAQGTDDLFESVTTAARAAGVEFAAEALLGRDAFVGEISPIEVMMLLQSGDTMFISVGSRDACAQEIESMVARQSEVDERRPFWDAVPNRVPGAVVEVFASISSMAEWDPEMEEFAAFVDTLYFGASIGEGRAAEFTLGGNAADSDLLAPFANVLRPANLDLLLLAPEDALAATTLDIDFDAMIEAILPLVWEGDDARESFDATLATASTAIGVDIQDELIASLTGEIVNVQFPFGMAGILNEDAADSLDAIGVYVFGISDSEPFLTLMETAEGLVGPDQLTYSDDGDAAVWLAEVEPGVEVAIRVEESRLVIGASNHVTAVVERTGSERPDGLVSGAVMELARKEFQGSYVAAFDFPEVMALAQSILESEQTAADLDSIQAVLEVVVDHVDGLALAELAIDPASASARVSFY